MPLSDPQLRSALNDIRKILDEIEARLDEQPGEKVDGFLRRRQILLLIYRAGNNVGRDELMRFIREHGTNYAWIGQQVRKEYLSIEKTHTGQRYSVTAKAVEEQRLDEDE